MRGRTFDAKSVEVGFAHDGGKIILVPKDDENAIAYADIYADISPTGLADADYNIDAVYMQTHSINNVIAILTGDAEIRAIMILRSDDGWQEWAKEEAREMMGEAA